MEENILELNRELEQLVTRQTARLRSATEELDAFSYAIAHDLRAPLRAINGFTSLIMENHASNLDEEGKRLLNIVKLNANRMGQLLDDMVAYSRINRQELEPMTLVDMNKMVNEIIGELQKDHPDDTLSFKIHDIAPVVCNAQMIHQVWANLISNAVKFTAGRAEKIVEIGSTEEKQEIIYFVKDSGVGFDMQFAQNMFGMFQRLHPAKAFDGKGVGLAIVKRIINKHDGKVWSEGVVDKGATLYFSLPRNRVGENTPRER
ncbi:MAG: ATP-binding protein [Bacteroidota bacterium]